MKRIFLTLIVLSTLALVGAFILGLIVGDPAARSEAALARFRWHFWAGFGSLLFAMLAHAIVLTYFMGTGRWLEETSQAYRLPDRWQDENRTLKYRTIPPMVGCLLLLILTGALGAAADPASPVGADTWAGVSSATLHFVVALATLGVNVAVNLIEYRAISRNGTLIGEVLQEVRRIRQERGLPVD